MEHFLSVKHFELRRDLLLLHNSELLDQLVDAHFGVVGVRGWRIISPKLDVSLELRVEA